MKTLFLKNSGISVDKLTDIATIKSMRWHYPLEKQIQWIEHNLLSEDLHVLLLNNDEDPIAYSNLVNINVIINGRSCAYKGIGNVCTSESGKGYGNVLMKEVNHFLLSNKMSGLLFCKDQLVDYYEKFNWVLIPRENIKTDTFKHVNFMVFNTEDPVKTLEYNGRNF